MRLVFVFCFTLIVVYSQAQNETELVEEKIQSLKKELLELDLKMNYPDLNAGELETKVDSLNSYLKSYISKLVNNYPNLSAKEMDDFNFLKAQLIKVIEVDSQSLGNNNFNKITIPIDSAAYVELLSKEISGVYFKIQILATESQLSGAKLSKDYGLNEEIYEERENGFHKYMVGKFSNYYSAKLKSLEINSLKGLDSFVVGYRNDRRTTLENIFGY